MFQVTGKYFTKGDKKNGCPLSQLFYYLFATHK